ncbi:hypothetical protein [Thalassospira marina]|uniref:Uncharacterized protein n=1 Tax=Thalassospira marina TaxID=2048283 RepID=A0ABM6Q9F7_9PROT|nr:hypothetical protein [Thalassospira marina]AUG53173.1 hypothetical protein CSC3H3_10925 [Thalassospira marina]
MKNPFLATNHEYHWNSCIGPQSSELNYIDGYIESSIELANYVLENKKYGKVDTLIFPILFNARHGIELTLKFYQKTFSQCGIDTESAPQNHRLDIILSRILNAKIPDRELSKNISKLAPYITGISEIDTSGQDFRYFENKNGHQSLSNHPIINLVVVRQCLEEMKNILDETTTRLITFSQERSTKTHTTKCSRADLYHITQELPMHAEWHLSKFKKIKENIKREFNLSNNQFDNAIKKIKNQRQLGSIIGIERNPIALTGTSAIKAAHLWKEYHAFERKAFDERHINKEENLMISKKASVEKIRELIKELKIEELADLETIFYLSRNREFVEHYEEMYEKTLPSYQRSPDIFIKVHHVFAKVNFLTEIKRGISILGNPSLADSLGKVEN